MTTSLDAVKPSSHAAHIISVGPATISRVFYIVADKEPLLCSTDLPEAVILLLMLHYIFWLEYPAKCKCSCKFLQERVLRRDAAEDGPVPVKLVRFMTKLL